MRTFVHPLPKAWIYSVKGYKEYDVLSLQNCPYEESCRHSYENVEKACNGKRILPKQSGVDGLCLCDIDSDDKRKLIPKSRVRFH